MMVRRDTSTRELGARGRHPGRRAHRGRSQHPEPRPSSQAVRTRAVAQAQGDCNGAIEGWNASESGATLVRGGRCRQEGAQDQALSSMNPMTTPKRVKLKPSPKGRRSRPRFAICIDNTGYPASLERWKIYRVLPDRESARHGQIRVIDESGEDYIFAAQSFVLVELPPPLRRLYSAKAVA